ncbi:MAG: murein L,D-transpeptidase catalytic domain-containing protein [Vicingaceae bacterium]
MEYGINNNARKRYIVLHGADYATENYIKKNGTLGNSKGCPAVPAEVHQSIIEVTKNGSCLFIYFPDLNYTEKSIFYNASF